MYTEACLLQNKLTADLAQGITKHLAAWEKINNGQLGCWRAEIAAQAGVDEKDSDLDETVGEIDHALYGLERDTKAPRYKRYFTKAPSAIVRMGLESELGVVRGWTESLAGEPDKPLQDLGKRLSRNVKEGDAAVSERRSARGRTKDHRVREIDAFVDEVNLTRRMILGELIQRGAREKLPKSWPARFFKKTAATAVAKDTDVEAPLAPASPAQPA